MKRRKKKTNKKLIRYLTLPILVMLILLVRLYDDIGVDVVPEERFNIIKVIDGDTVELKGGDRLRLLAIDTPEHNEPFYEEAKTFLRELTLSKQASIEYNRTRRDRYGRLLGYLYVDDIFINEKILQEGLGHLYLFKDNEQYLEETKRLLHAQKDAIDNRRGIWSIDKVSEEYYVVKEGSFRLHRPGCRAVAKLTEGRYRQLTDRFEGFREGLSPCRNCKP